MKKFTVLLVGLMLVALALPAGAEVEVKIGGKAWTQTGMVSKKNISPDYTTSDIDSAVSGLSRVEATVNIDGKKRGFVQLRPTGQAGPFTHLWVSADYAGGEILAGLTESVFSHAVGEVWGRTVFSGSPLLIGWGKPWGGRVAQVRYTQKIGSGDLKVSLEDAVLNTTPGTTGVNSGISGKTLHTTLPRIGLGFGQKVGNNTVYATLLTEMAKTNKDEVGYDASVTSYGLNVVALIVAGPAKITANVYTGQNLGIISAGAGYTAKWSGTEVQNASALGGFVDAEIPAGPVTLTLGYGMDSGDYADLTAMNKVKTAIFAAVTKKINANMSLGLGFNNTKTTLDGKEQSLSLIHI